MLFDDCGYSYTIKSIGSTGTAWRGTARHKTPCPAIVRQVGDEFNPKNTHNHEVVVGRVAAAVLSTNVKDKARAAPSKAAMAIVEEEMAKVKENLQQPSPRRTIWNVKQIVFVRQEDHNTEQTLTLRSIKTMSQRAFCDVTSIS